MPKAPPRFLLLIPLLLAAWLYLPSVRLPFFWDDVIHLRYVSEVSSREILTDPARVGYYRPVVNLILQLPFALDAHPFPLVWHLLVVWNHLLNVALVGALCRHARLGQGTTVVAMLIFAAFPFSFQAVIWVLAWFHPLATSLILLACLAGVRYVRRPRRRGMLLLAWLAGGAAPFVHENGVLAAPLTLLVITFARADFKPSLRRSLQLLLPMLAAAGVYCLILLGLAVLGAGERAAWADRGFNAAYFAQGLTFPVQFVVGRFSERAGAVWLGAAVFALGAALLARREGGRWIAFGLAWFLLASLPAALLLRQDYTTNAPRLLYLGAVGAAIGYGLIFRPDPRSRQKTGLILGLLALVLLFSIRFVRERMGLHLALAAGYADLRESAAGEGSTLVVNAPLWVDTEDHTFPLGKMGAIFLTNYFGLDDFLWANTGRDDLTLETVYFYPSLALWEGHVSGLKGIYMIDWGTMQGYIRPHDRVIVFGIEEDRFTARLVGRRGIFWRNLQADFNNGIRLEGVSLSRSPHGQVTLHLNWTRLADRFIPQVMFLHLLCDGQIIDQFDGSPLANLYTFGVWEVGEAWEDLHLLETGDAPPACLHLRIGLYDPRTGERSRLPDGAEFLLLDILHNHR